jgi:putative DNA-invertase from lambdoid prophage Rac
MSRVFAYCRVSTQEQTTENQVREIAAAGFNIEPHRVVEETISGSSAASQRSGFKRLLDRLERGDVLIVAKIDRLGRDVVDVVSTVNLLAEIGVRVHCLALGGMDLTSPAGKMTMNVLAAVAQFERDLLIERTQSGLERARTQGKHPGRPAALNHEQRILVHDALEARATVSALAREYDTSRQTILRARSATT